MCLLWTTGITATGETHTRNYSILRADGTSSVHQRTLEQWDIHTIFGWMEWISAWKGAACLLATRPRARIASPATSTVRSQWTDFMRRWYMHGWSERQGRQRRVLEGKWNRSRWLFKRWLQLQLDIGSARRGWRCLIFLFYHVRFQQLYNTQQQSKHV
jgi:hypothetical protein